MQYHRDVAAAERAAAPAVAPRRAVAPAAREGRRAARGPTRAGRPALGPVAAAPPSPPTTPPRRRSRTLAVTSAARTSTWPVTALGRSRGSELHSRFVFAPRGFVFHLDLFSTSIYFQLVCFLSVRSHINTNYPEVYFSIHSDLGSGRFRRFQISRMNQNRDLSAWSWQTAAEGEEHLCENGEI